MTRGAALRGCAAILGAGTAAVRQTGGKGAARRRPCFAPRKKKEIQWVDLVVKDEKARGFSVKLKFPIVLGLK